MMSGKRKPSTSSNNASSDEEDVGRTPDAPDKHDTSDTGYESVGSPGSVSTISVCSEQALEELRTSQPPPGSGLWPGARESTGSRAKTQPKKKKNQITLPQPPEVSEEPVLGTPKSRYRREPLPMKMRALPQSFWQQPNTNSTSPSNGSLPPLVTTSKDSQDLNDVRPVTPPERPGQERTRSLTVGNTELLFSLFDGVDPNTERRRVAVVKRGRPKKVVSTLPRVSLDDDPYMSSAASDPILPLLPERASQPGTPAVGRGTQILSVVQIPGAGDRESICLPSLSVEHNYSNILSQLVMKL